MLLKVKKVLASQGASTHVPLANNGTEFTSLAILKWCQETMIGWHYIPHSKPMRNGIVESFNGSFRDE